MVIHFYVLGFQFFYEERPFNRWQNLVLLLVNVHMSPRDSKTKSFCMYCINEYCILHVLRRQRCREG